jgi:CRP-like cAMP-binding protein
MLRPGDTFGEVSVFDLGTHQSAAEALEDCRVLFVPARSLFRVLGEHPEVGFKLLKHFARRLHSFAELIEQISLQTVQQRVARYIYMSATIEGEACREGIVIRRSMTQRELAALVGSVREVVGRTMRVLEEDGLVEIRRTDILVRDIAGLGRLL